MTENERIEAAVADAKEQFWGCIVHHFPEILTGDFSPDATFRFDDACEEAVGALGALEHHRPGRNGFRSISRIRPD